ncbi:universal stress protein [Nocardioides sp.]|uniref:universal stress protein n=1 Tax=Nocardioides sp. TaxID=35761 RepID=UPI001A3254CA|nr:universal stress protein [Nocardioides sp.]MBJ7356768.1 universal stress protein [Nocardioides sp.]
MNSPETGPVVVGVDGTPGSAGALRYAVAEAARRGASLRLVHVLPVTAPVWPGVPMSGVGDSELRDVATSILEESVAAVRDLAPDLEVVTRLSAGSRSGAVVEASEDAQLVVVGRETQHGVDRILVGAVTAAVAAHAHCGVAVVPSFWSGDHPRARVVVAMKSRANAHAVLTEAFSQARRRGASLTIVTAWELPDPYLDRIEVRTHSDDWEEEGRSVIEDVLTSWRREYPDVAVDVRVQHGRAAEVLLAASRDSDLLVLSRRHRAIPPYGHLGGVAHAILRASDVPVVVVPFTDAHDDPAEDVLVLEESGAPVK